MSAIEGHLHELRRRLGRDPAVAGGAVMWALRASLAARRGL
jgi:hypothetical protein